MPSPTRSPNPTLAFWSSLLKGKEEPKPLPTCAPEVEALLADIEYCADQAMSAALADDWTEVYRYQFDGKLLNERLGKLLAKAGVVAK